MAANYSLQDFIEDLERITRTEISQERIVGAAKPLLVKLVQQPDCIDTKYRKRGATAYGRYMLHRAPLFNILRSFGGPATTPRRTITIPGAWWASSRTRFRRHAFGAATTVRRTATPILKRSVY
jgi:hypothetical protein